MQWSGKILFVACLAIFAGPESHAQSPPRKLLIVDLDDVGIELLQATPTPHLDSLTTQGRYYPALLHIAHVHADAGHVPAGRPRQSSRCALHR